MSGGQLVVLDRLGRDVKRFPLAKGVVTLGSDHSCDIRFMLDTVNPHHATVAVHTNQTLVRNVCEGETLVNGHPVSVAALRHGDVISIGGRQLRWDYADPTVRRPQSPKAALHVARRRGGRGGRGGRRGSGPAPARRDPALQLAIEMSHRASMPDQPPPRTSLQVNKRPRASKNELDISMNDTDTEKAKRKSSARSSPKTTVSNLHNTTKATLWIESRKTSPRKSAKTQSPTQHVVNVRRNTVSAKKSTPLRLTVLKRAQSAQKMKVTKIEAPLKVDHTKQAAILLMTRHTPKSKVSRATDASSPHSRASASSSHSAAVTILEITDSDGRNSSIRNSSRRSAQSSFEKSPLLPSPKKSALKDPLAKKSIRKTESIKFDLSNLENHSQDSDVLMVTDTTRQSEGDSASEDDLTLHYSETSSTQSPSPRRSIHSRSSKILEKSLGTSVTVSPQTRTLTPESPRPRKSLRGSAMLQKVFNNSDEPLSYSRRTTKSASSMSYNTIVASPNRTRTLSPRSPPNDLESYSIVDLVSIDSNQSRQSTSVYNSAGSTNSTTFDTPQNSTGRKTRSTIDPSLLGSSTPYVKATRSSTVRSQSSPNVSIKTTSSSSRFTNKSSVASRQSSTSSRQSSGSSRKTRSISTPENTTKHISVNSTRISRASRSRSRINDSDLLLVEPEESDDSPRSSKRTSTASKRSSSAPQRGSRSVNTTPTGPQDEGTSTPENRQSPEEASTPVLSIQSLLDSSHNSTLLQSATRRGRPSLKRKTIGVLTKPKTRISDKKSKSMNFSARKTRLRLSNESYDNMNVNSLQDNEIVTPKSAVKLVQEAVKNKHSTAKKPQSKRSIIDDLNDSDMVKQLFNSPVKRKLSQSMTEFSRRQLFDDDDVVQVKRPTRNTVALTGRTPDNSLLDHTEAFTPERFVSPISTPTHSPNLDGIKLLFAKKSPENDLRNVRGVKGLLRTPRARKSIRNDLSNVSGVKAVFAKSPRNRLSDVRVKEVFASSPKNDLTRISGVKSLFQAQKARKSPRNSLGDVRGVKKLFKRKSPVNDLSNVSGVKRTLQRNTPNNDLRDVRGVKRMFMRGKQRNELSDLSGVEELFNESNQSRQDPETTFDQLIGKPTIKAVYSKTFSTKPTQKKHTRNTKSLHTSLDVIANNPEEWLEQELKKRLQHKTAESSVKSPSKSKNNLPSRELQKLATDTVEGTAPIRTSRVRNSTISKTSTIETTKPLSSTSEHDDSSKRGKQRNELNDVSGVELLNVSDLSHRDADNVFGQLVDKPKSKAVYSKSFITKSARKKNSRKTKSLNATRDVATERALKWLHTMEQEINERLEQKTKGNRIRELQNLAKDITTNKSSANLSRELQNLATATVEGTSPLRTSRVRNTTITRVSVVDEPIRQKSASELYSAHTLPIKKRSLVDASLERAKNDSKPIHLPIKKRAVVHSTPVKGRHLNMTMNASDLGRVSPIVADTTLHLGQHTTTTRSNLPKETHEIVPKSRRGTKTVKQPKDSPKKTRGKSKVVSPIITKSASPTKDKSPAKTNSRTPADKPVSPVAKVVSPKATRSRRTVAMSPKADINTRKRGATLVIAKKSPVLSPQPRASRKRKEPASVPTPKASPKRSRATRNKDEKSIEKTKTPKKTRAKVQKGMLVVGKPSPQLKPRATRGKAQQSDAETSKETSKTAAIRNKKVESPKKPSAQKQPAKEVTIENVPKTRGRKTAVTTDQSKQSKADVEIVQPKPTRGRKQNVEEEPVMTRKSRKTNKQESTKVEPKAKSKTLEQQDKPAEKRKKTRGNKEVQEESQPAEPTTRSRRTNKPDSTNVPEVNTRKRKATGSHDRPTKVSKSVEAVESRGRNKKNVSPKVETAEVPKKSVAKESTEKAPKKGTRSKKSEVSIVEPKAPEKRSTRGKKATAVEPAQEIGKRKRKPAVESPPAVVAAPSKKARGNKSPQARNTRAAATAAEKTTGRSRRR